MSFKSPACSSEPGADQAPIEQRLPASSVHSRLEPPPASLVWLALGTVYLVWGSTYLGIRFAIETMPPFLMAGSRFLVAGAIMYVVAGVGSLRSVSRAAWRDAFIVGGCLLLGGNGGVTFAEQFIPSGLTALLVGGVPIFLTLFAWWGRFAPRPSLAVSAALCMGFVGVGILVLPHSGQAETASANPGQWLLGTVSVLVACAIWAAGSLYSRRAVRPASPVLSVAIQMIAGGALLMLVAAVTGEFGRFSPMSVSPKSLWAWSYLVVFGSIIAFSAYVWVMRVAAPALVGTYAFVNPVVAVALGTALAGERFEGHTWVGAAVVLVAVAVIICFPQKAGRVT